MEKTFDDWSEYLYKLLQKKINNIFSLEKKIFIHDNIFSNKNFNINFFLKHPELKIDYNLLSYNPNVTYEYIVENKYFLWNKIILNKRFGKDIKNYILNNKYYNDLNKFYIFDILYEIYESWENILYIEKNYNHEIRYQLLSMNKNISWEIILNNIDKDWNFEYLVIYNENITVDIVLNNKKYFNDYCIKLLSKNKGINWNDILKHNEIEWNYKDISLNPNITFDIVLNNLDKKWCFHRLSSNPNITIDIIMQYNQFNWSMYWYSYNPKIQLNDIDKIKISNDEINDQILIIKNLFLNNYDFDRDKYFEENNIKTNKYINEILKNNNFEFSVY